MQRLLESIRQNHYNNYKQTFEEDKMREIVVTGNTSSVRDELTKLGGQYNKRNGSWTLPEFARDAVSALRVPVGGRVQLWEPCSCCGEEPVDTSGLCDECRGTESLTIEPLLTPTEEAELMVQDLRQFISTLYHHRPRSECDAPVDARHMGRYSTPYAPGWTDYDVDLYSDGQKLYLKLTGENIITSWYVVQTNKLKELDKIAVDLLIAQQGNTIA